MSQTNGTVEKTTVELREQLERYELQEQIAEHRFRTRLMEGLNDDYGRLVDMTDRWKDADGNYRTLGGEDERKRGSDPASGVLDLEQLRLIRDNSRILAQRNPYAKGLLKNYVNFIIRTGFDYEAQPIGGNAQTAAEFNDFLAAFFFRNQWPQREQEWARRCFRDGEVFARSYEDGNDSRMTLVRFLEPEQILNPPDGTEAEGWTFGKKNQTEPFVDLETIEAFGVAWGDVDHPTEVERVDASEIYHHKRNVDLTIKRGLPEFYAMGTYLDEAGQLMSNAGISARIQAAYTFIVQHAKATNAGVSSFRAGTRTFQGTDPTTGKTANYERVRPGKRLDIPQGMEYVDHPMWTSNTPQHLSVGQGLLRGAGASVCVPEFIVSGDASNANYASTLVAGGPMVVNAETEQNDYKQAFLAVIWKAAAKWFGKTAEEMQALVTIEVKPPPVEISDKLVIGQVRQLEVMNKARSPQDWARELGLDPEKMLQEWEDFNERMGQGTPVQQPYPQGFGDKPPVEPDDDHDGYGAPGAIKLSIPTRLQTTEYSCGAAAMQAVCEYFNVGTDSEAAFMRSLGTDSEDGTSSDVMVELAERLGLSVESGPLTSGEVMSHLQRGHPVLAHLGDGGGHYVVVTGMDDKTVWMMNPATGEEHATLDEWEGRWAPERWGMVVSGARKPAVESLSETVRSVLAEQEDRHAASMTELRTTLAALAAKEQSVVVNSAPVTVNPSLVIPSMVRTRREIERDPQTGLATAIVDEHGHKQTIERDERGLVKAIVEPEAKP